MGRLDPKFVLKEASSNKETLIYLVMWSNYKRMKIYIGEKIEPCFWDTLSQRPTANKSILRKLSPIVLKRLNYLSIRLDEIDLFVQNLIIDLKRDNQLSLDNIKSKLEIYFGRVKSKPKEEIFVTDYFLDVYQRMCNGILLTPKGNVYTKGTSKTYKSTLSRLLGFEEFIGKRLLFEDIDQQFYNKYILFCNEKKYMPNTIAKSLSIIKSYMNIAQSEGVHNNNFHNTKKFKIAQEDGESIYLTVDELERMYRLDLSEKKHLEIARDVFLIGCYTAQRYSDYSRIKKDYIRTLQSGNKVIDIITAKTKERVIIPFLFDNLEPLLKKYDYTVPKTYNQKMNKYIKEVAEMAGITEPVVLKETKGGKTTERKYLKCQLVTTHTARRSGATNLHKMGYSDLEVMKITGHSSVPVYLKYIKVSKEENADLMYRTNRIGDEIGDE
nr:MAG TPA: Integrase [Caudoviricetes sp.]